MASDDQPGPAVRGGRVTDLGGGPAQYLLEQVRVLGATEHPVQSWVVQQARSLLMDLEDAGTQAIFAQHDRDASFTQAFDAVFQATGIRGIRSAVQAPRMNSVMERWIGSCRRELLDRTLVWNLRHLMTVLREYEDFYTSHRPHRALHQAAPLRPLPDGVTNLDHFRVRRGDRVGGVIHEYRLVAWVIGTHSVCIRRYALLSGISAKHCRWA
jgi:hypothetical protein